MATLARIQGGKRPLSSKAISRLVVDGSTDTAALSAPAVATASASSWTNTEDFSIARLVFGGTNLADEIVNYQVILWTPCRDASGAMIFFPDIVAKGAYTLGAITLPTTVVAADGFVADTVTDTIGRTGSLPYSPADDSIAKLDIDVRNAMYLSVETDLDTAAAAYVFCQLGESLASMGDISVDGLGLATSALQGTTNTALGTIETDIEATNTALGTIETDVEATNTAIGATDAALVAAGAVGSVTAKLRRLTTDLAVVNTAVKNQDMVLSASALLVVTSTTGDIATKYGAALPAGTLAIVLVPDTTIAVRFKEGGAASAATARVPESGMVYPITNAVADAAQLYSATNTSVSIYIFVARN